MRNILAICKRELLSFFVSPIAYFVITGFMLLAGFFFFQNLAFFFQVLQMAPMMNFRPGQMPNLNEYVVQGFYQTLIVVLVFMVPLLTMRTIADEKRRGTFELLITSPVTVGQIVLGKFLSLATIIVIMLGLTFIYPYLLMTYGEPEVYPILSGFLGLVLCTLAFASIGMAASSFTENQIVAGISSMVVLLMLYVIHAPSESVGGPLAEVLKYLSPVVQVSDLIQGVITLKSLAYFGSLIVLGLFLSQRALEAHRWR